MGKAIFTVIELGGEDGFADLWAVVYLFSALSALNDLRHHLFENQAVTLHQDQTTRSYTTAAPLLVWMVDRQWTAVSPADPVPKI